HHRGRQIQSAAPRIKSSGPPLRAEQTSPLRRLTCSWRLGRSENSMIDKSDHRRQVRSEHGGRTESQFEAQSQFKTERQTRSAATGSRSERDRDQCGRDLTPRARMNAIFTRAEEAREDPSTA